MIYESVVGGEKDAKNPRNGCLEAWECLLDLGSGPWARDKLYCLVHFIMSLKIQLHFFSLSKMPSVLLYLNP